jgi:hypothetical protein
VANDPPLPALDVLDAYRRQPQVERWSEQLKPPDHGSQSYLRARTTFPDRPEVCRKREMPNPLDTHDAGQKNGESSNPSDPHCQQQLFLWWQEAESSKP